MFRLTVLIVGSVWVPDLAAQSSRRKIAVTTWAGSGLAIYHSAAEIARFFRLDGRQKSQSLVIFGVALKKRGKAEEACSDHGRSRRSCAISWPPFACPKNTVPRDDCDDFDGFGGCGGFGCDGYRVTQPPFLVILIIFLGRSEAAGTTPFQMTPIFRKRPTLTEMVGL